jgi:hypothetical protein
MDVAFNSWPLAAVICFVAFLVVLRAPLDKLVGRIKSFKVGNHSVDASGDVSEQQKKVETITTASNAPVPTSEPVTFPPPNEIYAPIEHEMRDAGVAANVRPDIEKAWLIRVAAIWRVWCGHERAYRLITGSQLELLLRANSAPLKMDTARQMYEAAKANYSDLYKEFSFETWVTFPMNSGLLREEASGLRITLLGQDFLHYLVNNSLTNTKYG